MALVRGGIQIRTIYHLHKISTRKFHYRRWFPTVDLHSQKKETIPYPICSVVAVFKMLVRILNTLRSRIWDMVLFLFSVFWLQKE